MLEMDNQPQQMMDSRGGHARLAGVRSVTADIKRLTETMGLLETYVDSLLDRSRKVSDPTRRSPK
jgi:hypothetical protein